MPLIGRKEDYSSQRQHEEHHRTKADAHAHDSAKATAAANEIWICITETSKQKEAAAEAAKQLMNLTFQASDAKKPLISVKRIVERGNHVQFGPTEGDCFISNPKSGKKMPLKFDGKGSWVMEVELEGDRHWITVDSGAQESVCPKDWGVTFPIVTPDTSKGEVKKFITANGAEMNHYGQRTVRVAPF